jgi:hypothetical protein
MQSDGLQHRVREALPQKWKHKKLMQVILPLIVLGGAIALCCQQVPQIVQQTSCDRGVALACLFCQ